MAIEWGPNHHRTALNELLELEQRAAKLALFFQDFGCVQRPELAQVATELSGLGLTVMRIGKRFKEIPPTPLSAVEAVRAGVVRPLRPL